MHHLNIVGTAGVLLALGRSIFAVPLGHEIINARAGKS
jgi:hypothetical protein